MMYSRPSISLGTCRTKAGEHISFCGFPVNSSISFILPFCLMFMDSLSCVTHPAGGPCAGGGDRHPQVSVGVSLLNDVVGDSTAAIVKWRVPGDHHVVPVDLIENHGSLWWLWTV